MTSFEKRLLGSDKLKVPRSSVQAVTHVNYSAQIQTVDSNTNPHLHAPISKFKKKTGCSLIVYTSFNVRAEPIVCSPKDAFKFFMGTDLDILIEGDYLLIKVKQDIDFKENYEDFYELS